MNSNRIKSTIGFVLVAVVLGAGAYFYKQSAESAPTGPGGRPGGGGPGRGGPGGGGARARVVTVGAAKAEIGTINERLLLTGALKPKEMVDVTPKATGRVEKIHFHVGDMVKVGDLVAELDRDELEQQVRRAEASTQVAKASLAQRRAELANAEAQFRRAEQLQGDGLISNQDFDAQKTQMEVVRSQVLLSEAQLQQAEAEVRELNIRLEQTNIFAPINGQVSARYVDVGAVVGPNTPIVRVVNLRTMVTAANVPEREIGKLRIGNKATVNVDAFGAQVFTGRVARIGPVLDAATRSATIEIEIANPDNLLKAEMFARVQLDLASTRQTVLIPREGLVYRGTQAGVYLVNKDRPEFRSIETGLTEGDRVEVLANLEPGTVIVGRGSTMISEGDRIRVAGEAGPPRGKPGASNVADAAGDPTRVARVPDGAVAKTAQ